MTSLAVALGAMGCAKKRPVTDLSRPQVVKIQFDGNGDGRAGSAYTPFLNPAGDFALRSAMEQGQNPRLTWLIRPRRRLVQLDRDTLELDAWRIETWYAHHGWFEARVIGWDVRQTRGKIDFLWWKSPPRVRIRGQVRQGDPSVVSKLEWEGLDALGGPMLAWLRQNADLTQGARFDLEALRYTEATTLERLQEQGYAYATVRSDVQVDAEARTVEVRIIADTGPVCEFGDVAVEGVLPVPEHYVSDELLVEKGERYGLDDMRRTQRKLFGLGVFSVVNVKPMLDDRDDPVVPVRVELAPSRTRQLRVGGGAMAEPGKQDVHVGADFKHVNLFNRLVRLEVGALVGYTTLTLLGEFFDEDGNLTDIITTGAPTLHTGVEVVVPRVPTRGWEVFQRVDYEQGIEPGYTFRRVDLSPGLRARLTPKLTSEFAYAYQYFDFLDVSGAEQTDYGLSYLRQQLTWDRRDDALFPRKGLMSSVTLQEAGSVLGGDFTYFKAEGDQRVYVPIRRIGGWRPRGTVAMRVGGGFIQPLGGVANAYVSVPLDQRLYLGGGNTVRAWPRRQLGPYLYSCGAEGGYCISQAGLNQPANAEIIPIGGLLSMYSSFEVRALVTPEAGFALFTDAGMVWEDIEHLSGFPLQPTVGAGLRYKTPIGPLRLDLGYRLLDPPEFDEVSRIGLHFSLSESF